MITDLLRNDLGAVCEYGGGMSKMKAGGGVKMAAGGGVAPSKMGKVKTAAPSRDGVAVKGKTKGKMVAMRGK